MLTRNLLADQYKRPRKGCNALLVRLRVGIELCSLLIGVDDVLATLASVLEPDGRCNLHDVSAAQDGRRRTHPGFRASEAGQVLRDRLKSGNELRGGRADADQSDALAGEIETFRPVGRVHASTLEGVETGRVGPLPGVEDARAVDEEVAVVFEIGRGVVVGADGEVPLRGVFVPNGA